MIHVVAAFFVEDFRHLGARRCVNATRGEVSFLANGWRFVIYAARYISAATAIRRVCNAKHLNSVIFLSHLFFPLLLIRTITLPFPLIFPFLMFRFVFVFPSPQHSFAPFISACRTSDGNEQHRDALFMPCLSGT